MSDNFAIRTSWLAGELASAVGVSTDTLRHYERKGVLPRPGRTANGYRRYPEGSLERVLLVRRALSVGFTLDQLAAILRERDNGGAPCRQVRELAGAKLLDVEEQLKALTAMKDELAGLVAEWDRLLAETPLDEPAGLLHGMSLETRSTKNGSAKLPLSQKSRKRKSQK